MYMICIFKVLKNNFNIMVTKQREWFKAMIKTGCLLEYIYSQPMFFAQKLKRYSLRRFIRKHFKI